MLIANSVVFLQGHIALNVILFGKHFLFSLKQQFVPITDMSTCIPFKVPVQTILKYTFCFSSLHTIKLKIKYSVMK